MIGLIVISCFVGVLGDSYGGADMPVVFPCQFYILEGTLVLLAFI